MAVKLGITFDTVIMINISCTRWNLACD